MRLLRFGVASGVVLLLLVTQSLCVTVRVPQDHPTIESGLAAAAAGDTVLVACGTYFEHDLQLPSGVLLCGQIGDPGCVVIDAGGLGRVLSCVAADSTTALTSLTLRGGAAGAGGGMYSLGSALLIRDCLFQSNTATGMGGGLCCEGYPSPRLEGCTFSGNTASWGGGMCAYATDSAPILASGLSFLGNSAGLGGGLRCVHSNIQLADAVFVGNHALVGGGMDATTGVGSTLRNVLFALNTADEGGGFHPDAWECVVTNATFYRNAAALGAGVSSSQVHPRLERVIICFSEDGAAVHGTEYECAMCTCCDFFGNAGGDWVGCVASQAGIDGNISAEPSFCDETALDLTLDMFSACAPEQSPCGELIGAYGVGCGASVVRETTWSALKALFGRRPN